MLREISKSLISNKNWKNFSNKTPIRNLNPTEHPFISPSNISMRVSKYYYSSQAGRALRPLFSNPRAAFVQRSVLVRTGTGKVLVPTFAQQLTTSSGILGNIMGNKHHRVVDGVAYTVRQDMVRNRKIGWKEWFFKKILSKYIGIPFLSILAPIWYLLVANMEWAREIMSRLTWIFMPWIDQSLVDVKRELVKDIEGKRVLDFGHSGGDWLKYLGGASLITELEPDKYHLRIVNKAVDEFLALYPNANVEVTQTPIDQLKVIEPYDVIILGNVLCDAPDTKQFLQDVDRVLRPGGKVVFQESIREPQGTFSGIIQDLFNFWWRMSKKGAQVTKNPVDLLKDVGKWHVEAWDLRVDGAVLFDRVAVGVAVKSKIP